MIGSWPGIRYASSPNKADPRRSPRCAAPRSGRDGLPARPRADARGRPPRPAPCLRVAPSRRRGRRLRPLPDITSDLELAKFDGKRRPNHNVNGVFWILLLNLGIYVADHILRLQEIKSLYLYHICPVWYQFVTATFCHANWNHLSSNLFFLYIFGKLVEEEQGNFALWISYILAGAGANLVSWLLLPKSAVSVGASGAVFGLFVISVLVKMSWDWRKIIEVLILGQFVIEKVMEAAQASTSLTGTYGRGLMAVNHIAHISGALIGAALVLLVSRIPSQPSGQDDKNKRS
ncbi:rhomboid-like protein 11, chloroplastic isoform X1 [Musa acuminata AAA Group]|uniref:rhomboid-like protein 11, chloroplastic isoform X1 n=1 Tax=Musa acuminata AAA Group TaxID=214697 RepID=UPI0031E1E604